MGHLTSAGSSSVLRKELFPAGFAGEVMALLLNVWKDFSRHPDVQWETCITALFRDALIAAYVAAGRAWFIELEAPTTDPTFGTQVGRNDLRIYPPSNRGQTVFLVVECKRLRMTWPSGFRHLADQYVEEGVQRFVDGQYAGNLPCGAMLGYVMDNQLDEALANIRAEIEARRANLKIETQNPLQTPSSTLPDYRWSADSFHHRGDDELCIHHLLVAASAELPRQPLHH